MKEITITKENLQNSKIMLANATLRPLSILAYNYEHCDYLEKLVPLIAAPWFIGTKLFIKSQWIDSLILDDLGVEGYDIRITKNMIKGCKCHGEIISSIYEALKEIYAITNYQYFNSIPTWLGLIIHDFITYRVHTICVDECLQKSDLKTANNNIKNLLILKEERFKNSLENGLIFHKQESFPENTGYVTYSATNKFIELCKLLKYQFPKFEQSYYDKFISSYKNYIKYLRTKIWCVAVIDESGNFYVNRKAGRIPNYIESKYNKILWIK